MKKIVSNLGLIHSAMAFLLDGATVTQSSYADPVGKPASNLVNGRVPLISGDGPTTCTETQNESDPWLLIEMT